MADKARDLKLKWENVLPQLANAIAFARSQEASRGAAGTTLHSSIAEALKELDSHHFDTLSSLGTSTQYVEEENSRSLVRKGRLQRIEDLIMFYFGEDGESGFLSELEKLADLPD